VVDEGFSRYLSPRVDPMPGNPFNWLGKQDPLWFPFSSLLLTCFLTFSVFCYRLQRPRPTRSEPGHPHACHPSPVHIFIIAYTVDSFCVLSLKFRFNRLGRLLSGVALFIRISPPPNSPTRTPRDFKGSFFKDLCFIFLPYTLVLEYPLVLQKVFPLSTFCPPKTAFWSPPVSP